MKVRISETTGIRTHVCGCSCSDFDPTDSDDVYRCRACDQEYVTRLAGVAVD